MSALPDSYHYCRDLTRRTAHNFRFSFMTLPREKRKSMEALYAFNRITDDLGDDESTPLPLRQTQLNSWRESLRLGLGVNDSPRGHVTPDTSIVGTFWNHPALAAIIDMSQRHQIPHEYLLAVIDGVEMDMKHVEMQNFAELERYCYHVAGAVGLCCIHVWGFRNEQAIPLAIDCGLALQLTNILRDLSEDAELGRIYLPREDLDRFGYTPEELIASVRNDRFINLMKFQTGRARSYYAKAERLFQFLDPDGRRILRAMIDIYRGLLDEIERRQYDVFTSRISLPKWKKLWYATRAVMLPLR